MTYDKVVLLFFIGLIPVCGQSSPESFAEVDCLNEEAWNMRYAHEEEALSVAFSALQLAQKVNYAEGISNSLNYLGLIYAKQGYYLKAKEFFLKSKEERIKLKDTIGVAGVLNNLGTLECDNGNLDLAFQCLFEAASVFEQFGVDSSLANAYNNIANTYDKEGNLERALVYYKKGLEAHQVSGNPLYLANAHYNLAGLYYMQDELELSVEHALIARELYLELNDWKREGDILNVLASVAWAKEDYSRAETFFQKAIEICRTHDDYSLRLVDLHSNFGSMYIEKGEAAKAIVQLRQAQHFLKGKGGLTDHMNLAINFTDAYKMLEQYDSAFAYQSQAATLQDSLFQMDKNEAIAEMQTRFETERTEKELAEEKLRSQELTAQKQLLLQLLIAALIISGLIYFFFRQRQKTTAIIAQQKIKIHQQEVADLLQNQELKMVNAALEGQEVEQKRIAKDLHDRLGSLLTTIKWQMDDFLESQKTKQEIPLQKTSAMLDEAYHEVRRIAYNMNSGVLAKFGLLPALEELRMTLVDSGKLKVELLSHGLTNRLETTLEILVYRIIQELVSNVLKHAQATQISIQLYRTEELLQIIIEDDGSGFSPEKIMEGMGLKNIEARIQSWNGSWEIDSGKGGGTSIFIDIPLV